MDILIVDQEKTIQESTCAALESVGHYAEGVGSAEAVLHRLQEDHFELVLLDIHLGEVNGLDVLTEIQQRWPKIPVIIFTAHATVESAVEALRRGACDYLEKPFSADQLRHALARVQRAQQLENRINELETQLTAHSPEPEFESFDDGMKRVYDILFRAAGAPASIMILGESGTGKSVLAKAIHQRSPLREKPFVTVNCPSLSKELLESELFGYVKGAFTGAVRDTWGKVEAADRGTLFLDEIGELPLEIQPKLLRLLQEREYERLGENKTRSANVRVIAATNRNLREILAQGRFREDLYYRLNVIAVEVLPIRERPKDLVHFAEAYLKFFSTQSGCPAKRFSDETFKCLTAYHWPGNLRELRNAIERAAILADSTEITPEDLPLALGGEKAQELRIRVGAAVTLKELETEHIHRILGYARSFHQAAKILGIDETTLYRKRKKFASEETQAATRSRLSAMPASPSMGADRSTQFDDAPSSVIGE